MTTEFKRYRRTQVAELRPYEPGETLDARVSISAADLEAGSPKAGDMIARNPENHADQWLIAADYFAANFEAAAVDDNSWPQICGARRGDDHWPQCQLPVGHEGNHACPTADLPVVEEWSTGEEGNPPVDGGVSAGFDVRIEDSHKRIADLLRDDDAPTPASVLNDLRSELLQLYRAYVVNGHPGSERIAECIGYVDKQSAKLLRDDDVPTPASILTDGSSRRHRSRQLDGAAWPANDHRQGDAMSSLYQRAASLLTLLSDGPDGTVYEVKPHWHEDPEYTGKFFAVVSIESPPLPLTLRFSLGTHHVIGMRSDVPPNEVLITSILSETSSVSAGVARRDELCPGPGLDLAFFDSGTLPYGAFDMGSGELTIRFEYECIGSQSRRLPMLRFAIFAAPQTRGNAAWRKNAETEVRVDRSGRTVSVEELHYAISEAAAGASRIADELHRADRGDLTNLAAVEKVVRAALQSTGALEMALLEIHNGMTGASAKDVARLPVGVTVPKPSVGRIVHYSDPGGRIFPAIIVGVDESGLCDLQVFRRTDVQPVTLVGYVEKAGVRGPAWSWPPRT